MTGRSFARRLWDRLRYAIQLLLLESGFWIAFILLLLLFVVRFVLLIPLYPLAVILASLEWLQMRFDLGKRNLILRKEDEARRARLDAITEPSKRRTRLSSDPPRQTGKDR